MRQNARKLGLMLGVLMLAVLLVGIVAIVPAPVSAQDAVLFEQPPTAPGQGSAAYSSDTGIGLLCMEDFLWLTGDITDIHWYGFSWLLEPKYGSYDCDPTGMEFQIIFYKDSGGSPGAPVATFSNVTPTITFYNIYGDSSAYCFDVANLGTPVSLTQGWVSIQSTSSPNGCAFFWLTSPTGNTNAIQQGNGEKFVADDNLAFALTGVPLSPPVGGEAYPVDKISLLAPWIAVAVLLAGGISWYALRRRKA